MSDEINRALGEIKGKQDMMLTMLEHLTSDDGTLSRHDKRIQSLEHARTWAFAVMSVFGAIGGIIGNKVYSVVSVLSGH